MCHATSTAAADSWKRSSDAARLGTGCGIVRAHTESATRFRRCETLASAARVPEYANAIPPHRETSDHRDLPSVP